MDRTIHYFQDRAEYGSYDPIFPGYEKFEKLRFPIFPGCENIEKLRFPVFPGYEEVEKSRFPIFPGL